MARKRKVSAGQIKNAIQEINFAFSTLANLVDGEALKSVLEARTIADTFVMTIGNWICVASERVKTLKILKSILSNVDKVTKKVGLGKISRNKWINLKINPKR